MIDITLEPVKFFMVWTKTGRSPKFIHETFEGAHTEAVRLSLEIPGRKFIVLEAVEKVSRNIHHLPTEDGSLTVAMARDTNGKGARS